MPYRFATQDQDYSDFSGGRVLYSLPGYPAFPVRLSSEIFQRAVRHLDRSPARLHVYDPTCGGAYHLTALGLLHGEQIQTISASDVDEGAVRLARRNLSLLQPDGMQRREDEIRRMYAEYGKPSHADALRSTAVLRDLLQDKPAIETHVFEADALDPAAVERGLQGAKVDLVISDIPYGQMSGWVRSQTRCEEATSPPYQMLEALLGVLAPQAVAAMAADKAQKIAHPAYERVEHFKLGKRQVVVLRPKR